MTEMAARKEQFQGSVFPAPSYTWEVTGKPVAVDVALSVIDRLERDVASSFRQALTSLGSEIGGVLFGTTRPGNPARVAIEDYELVPCEYSLGPLYRLSEKDLEHLDRVMAQGSRAGLEPVGFFRSNTRRSLSLDAE